MKHTLSSPVILFCILSIGSLLSCQSLQVERVPISISSRVFGPLSGLIAGYEITGLENQGHGGYLALPLPYDPVRPFFSELAKREMFKTPDAPLVSRGEAHVTVITPPEFEILRQTNPPLTLAEIEHVARAAQLESLDLVPICLGRGQARIEGRLESTYFIVVRSAALLRIRREIQELFRQRGGKTDSFNADRYFPHVTIGFTKVDLHEHQGVLKGENSCLYPLTLVRD